jgi:hypothetical protein
VERPDFEAGLDGLQNDMAEHQRRFRGEVTAESNRAMAVDAIQRLDNEQAESKPAPAPAVPMQQQPIESKLERREINGSSYLLKKEADTGQLVRKASKHEAWFLAHAMPRVALLMSKPESGPLGQPSWRARILAVMAIQAHAASLRAAADHPDAFAAQKRAIEAMQPLERAEILKAVGAAGISDLTVEFAKKKAVELDKRFLAALLKVLEESTAVFGDWKKDAPKKLQVG